MAAFVPGVPPWVGRLGHVGIAAFCALAAYWAIVGFGGYEHHLGRRLVVARRSVRLAPFALGLAVLLAVAVAALETGHRSIAWVVVAAVAGALLLVLVVAARMTLFAALSALGVAIGVAALIVLRSVATGFQHEFERRVLGVYAHVNVTRPFGIAEYRRFQAWLEGLPGVVGASPFAYYGMALAPYDPEGRRAGDLPQASVLVKGIDPETAGRVIDLREHLERASPGVEIGDLRSHLVLQPVRDRDDEHLPTVIAMTPDPRGPDAYERALAAWRSAPPHLRAGGGPLSDFDGEDAWGDDDWPATNLRSVPPSAGGDLPTIFIGKALARELDLDVGDTVVLVDPGRTGGASAGTAVRHFRVAGIFEAGFQEYDTRLVYVHIKELQAFKFRGRDEVSGIDLRLEDPALASEVAAVIRAALGSGEYTVLEWHKLNANLFQSIHTQKSVLTVILSLVTAVAGFNVLASLWTMVVRRQAEIAILMSMGAHSASIGRIFQFAGLTIGTLGAMGGLLYGLLLCRLLEQYGYALDPEVYFIDALPVEYDAVQILAIVVATVAVSLLATIPPALRAARLRPLEGLRYE
ncbi:MAG: ABC transporter permease [Deltaproteobacteria bacterium]|nr:MAG: ABC transporter permease [Deltaproteobacteria bacterium]